MAKVKNMLMGTWKVVVDPLVSSTASISGLGSTSDAFVPASVQLDNFTLFVNGVEGPPDEVGIRINGTSSLVGSKLLIDANEDGTYSTDEIATADLKTVSTKRSSFNIPFRLDGSTGIGASYWQMFAMPFTVYDPNDPTDTRNLSPLAMTQERLKCTPINYNISTLQDVVFMLEIGAPSFGSPNFTRATDISVTQDTFPSSNLGIDNIVFSASSENGPWSTSISYPNTPGGLGSVVRFWMKVSINPTSFSNASVGGSWTATCRFNWRAQDNLGNNLWTGINSKVIGGPMTWANNAAITRIFKSA